MTNAILQSKVAESILIKTPLIHKKKRLRKKFLVKRWGGEGSESSEDIDNGITEQGF